MPKERHRLPKIPARIFRRAQGLEALTWPFVDDDHRGWRRARFLARCHAAGRDAPYDRAGAEGAARLGAEAPPGAPAGCVSRCGSGTRTAPRAIGPCVAQSTIVRRPLLRRAGVSDILTKVTRAMAALVPASVRVREVLAHGSNASSLARLHGAATDGGVGAVARV